MEVSPLSGTLAGIRVLDLTRNLAGPFCTMLLADLGADVIKVEKPGSGDDTRSWRPPRWSGHSATFLSANRNKRGIAVDLDVPDGRRIVAALAERADVIVESFRPGSLTKRGLDFATVSATNAGVVYCSISAYGSHGPKADRPGYDPVLQADTGIMDLTGYPAEPPARLGIGAIDLGAALWATVGIQAGLANRARTGKGTLVEASLFETATWWLSYHLMGYLGTGQVPHRHGSATPFIAPYEAFPTADGDLFVAAANDGAFAALTQELGVPELARDPRYLHNEDRVANRDALRAILLPRLLTHTSAEWETLLHKRSVPCSRIRSVADLADDPQLNALGLLTALPHADVPDLRVVDTPISLDAERATHRMPPPKLGEHTDEVLRSLGIDPTTLAQLRADGIVS